MMSKNKKFENPADSNFNLKEDEFIQMVEYLKLGDERILHQIAKHQIKKSIQYLRRKFYIKDDYAYDLCMDTLLQFRRKLLADKLVYGNLSFLFNKMASNLYIDKIKIRKRERIAIEQFFDLKQSSGSEENIEPFYEALNVALKSLNEEDLMLIKDMYQYDKRLVEIAKNYSVSDNTIRKRKQRLLERLRTEILPSIKF